MIDSNATTPAATKEPILYLFPSTLSDSPLDAMLPALNSVLIAEVKHFIVENIRTARRFLKKCDRNIDIDSLTFSVLNVNTPPSEVPAMLRPLAQGHSVGVISEAGCPAVADPGALAVAEAHRRGFRVVPLVGPSSILLALMASGFNGQSFTFNGYLPIDSRQRADALRKLHREAVKDRRTQIFIETPYRNNRLISEIVATLPDDAMLCVASDLTGPSQRIISRPVSKWRAANLDFDKTPAIFLLGSIY